jgi:hypothetical protein
MTDNRRKQEYSLDPSVLRSNLIVASIYITAFEVLKNTIVGRIRRFFTRGFDQNGPVLSPQYQSDVLSKNPSPVYASLEWLRRSGAIDDDDIAMFEHAKKCRNDVAHDITVMLADGLPADVAARFPEIVSLVDKIERWWIVNVDMALDPIVDAKGMDEAQAVPGAVLSLRVLADVALGPEENLKEYIEEFRRRNLSKKKQGPTVQ